MLEDIGVFFESLPVFNVTMGLYLILGIAAIYFTWQAIKNRKSYKLGVHILLAVTPIAIIGVIAAFGFLNTQKEHRITDAMQAYVSTSLTFKCVSQIDELFVASNADDDPVWIEGSTIFAKQTTCNQINAYMKSTSRSTLAGPEVYAIHALNRAIMIGTTTKELPQAECFALQYDNLLAESLGASQIEGITLRAYYYEKMFPNVRNKYYSAQCKDGGSYALYDLDKPLFKNPNM